MATKRKAPKKAAKKKAVKPAPRKAKKAKASSTSGATRRPRRAPKKAPNLRASPEAIDKRRAARALNTVLSGKPSAKKTDGRTWKRRQRLLKELSTGHRKGSPLRPLDVLQNAQSLLDIGEPISSIKKAAGRKHHAIHRTDESMAAAAHVQAAYGFDTRLWTLLGIRLHET